MIAEEESVYTYVDGMNLHHGALKYYPGYKGLDIPGLIANLVPEFTIAPCPVLHCPDQVHSPWRSRSCPATGLPEGLAGLFTDHHQGRTLRGLVSLAAVG